MFRKVLVFLLAFTLLPVVHVRAEQTPVMESEEHTLVFSANAAYQAYSFIDEDGLVTKVAVTTDSVSGEKTISMQNINLSMEYKIYVSNSYITSAYDQWYYSPYWTVKNDSLTVDSNTQATYSLECSRLLAKTTKYLRANIINGELSISYN